MNSFFKILLLFAITTAFNNVYARTSGFGCRDGNRIYVNYLGTSEWYGTTFKVYDINGPSYEIYYNSDPANNYDCHKINSNQAYNQVNNATYVTSNNANQGTCWIDNIANKSNTSQGGYATYVSYTIDCPANKTANLPLDDYTPFLIIPFGIFAIFFIQNGLHPGIKIFKQMTLVS
ncbi:hypothetical protein [Pedobacter sp. CFBP9032]|uniref:hypothetical protein n=1 Tax=Pedobacter sp. CFBP9032 TaxID=3096539 RepID=UPI002A69F539|nr:hypothetical protein [Pedobacter sp. CFBP9032]MDY0907431.1 hypothetical protein [Pedobacter sp. CFBP9032]